MAGYSSPFHTLHDTIGASTLVTPLVMPSSPPSLTRDDEEPGTPDSPAPKSTTPRRNARDTRRNARDTRRDAELDGEDEEDDDRFFARQRDFDSPVLSRASSPDHSGVDIDARLAEYSIDFSRLPGATLSGDGEEEFLSELKGPEIEKLSDVGGPEDFTANLERYLMGDDDDDHHYNEQDTPLRRQLQNDLEASIRKDQERDNVQKENQKEEIDEEDEEEHKLPEQTDLQHQQNSSTGNEQELGEYSEFGPPVDMSTPSHFLRRSNSGQVTQLEDIEEDDDEIDEAATPSKVLSTKGDDKDLHRQIAELQKAVQDRDEQIQKNHKQILEGASAAEQNKRLQAELQEKTESLESLRAEKDRANHSTSQRSENAADISGIQRQMAEMQKELQSRNSQTDLDTERLETIAHLRQQLGGAQEQLKKRDETLDETVAKLREMITTKDKELQEKNTEIDSLRTRVEDQALEIEKLETDVDQANAEYQTLEGRIRSLETKNRPLEEKNSTLEADLERAQSQVTAQENALKAMAADHPAGNGGQKTFAEILDLIKDLGPPSPTEESAYLAPPGFPAPSNVKLDEEGRLRQELSKLQAEMNVRSQVQRTLETELSCAREQNAETQSLLKSIKDENARLSRQLKQFRSTAEKAQCDLDQLRTEHTSAYQKIEILHDDQNKIQQPSPPPSPPTARNTTTRQQHGSSPGTATTAQLDANLSHLQRLLAQAEKRETRLRTEIQSLRASQPSQDTRIQLQSLTVEIQRLEATIAAKDETAAEMDSQIARSVEKREKEWERRVELLLKERERMSRALMWTWGEKEVGEKSKANVYTEDGKKIRQGYRYKYVNPSASGAKSGRKTSS